jgi:hypothetical protein
MQEAQRDEPAVEKLYRVAFFIAGLPKRFNQSPGASWRARYGVAKKWQAFVATALVINGGAPKKPLRKARITFVRHSSVAPDYDGLVQSFKPVMDALKKCKVIEDDSMEHVGAPVYGWRKAPRGAGRIWVEVIGVED